jgi:hypothetical protein
LATWDALLEQVLNAPSGRVDRRWIYYLAHIPWHGDIAFVGEPISEVTKEYVRKKLAEFGEVDVIRLLRFIDPETGIARGVVGQSVEALVSSLPRGLVYLDSIVRTPTIEIATREWAALILAMNNPRAADESIQILVAQGSWIAGELRRVLKETGHLNPYA